MIIKTNQIDNNQEFPIKSLSHLLPSKPSQFNVDPDQWKVATSFVGQAIVKQVLTDCEKYVMTIFNLLTLSKLGIFDVVSNVGSLAARFEKKNKFAKFSTLIVSGLKLPLEMEI